jgi:predicted branched-subunit amino acid permease
MALGLVPFGLAIGGTIASSSTGLWPALASGPIILAGAAHLATLQMLEAGVAPVVVVASALLINLRIVLYSATLAPWFAGVPRRRRLALAATITDQLYFLCVERFRRGDLDVRGRTAYYAGAAGCLVSIWLGSQYTAALLGAELPAEVRLDMAAPLALAGLLARSARTGSARVAAAAAMVVVAAGAGLPLGSSILIATLGGILAATAVEGFRSVDR